MATAAAAAAAAAVLPPTKPNIASSMSSTSKTNNKNVRQAVGLNSYGGLKAHTAVLSLGLPVTTEWCFAGLVRATYSRKKRGGGGGGSLSATCSKVDEIFQIAAIMNMLTLIGVAIGFVLLKIEATVEESE